MAEPRDIGSTLNRARFQLAQLIAARSELHKSIDDLLDARLGLAPGDPVREELVEQYQRLTNRHLAIAEQISARIDALQRLASGSAEFAYQRAAGDRAWLALWHASDVAARTEGLPDMDPVQTVAERIELILDAYRELIALFGPTTRMLP